jgi:hypothetical protein
VKASDNDLGDKLTVLAGDILDKLLAPDNATPLAEKIDAVRVIGTLHLGMRKLGAKVEPDEESETSLPAMRGRLKAVGGE